MAPQRDTQDLPREPRNRERGTGKLDRGLGEHGSGPRKLQKDTLQLLSAGVAIFGTGVLAAVLMLTAFGGIERRQGPHTTAGWLALVVAMGCLPTGALTLALALVKVLGDRSR